MARRILPRGVVVDWGLQDGSTFVYCADEREVVVERDRERPQHRRGDVDLGQSFAFGAKLVDGRAVVQARGTQRW